MGEDRSQRDNPGHFKKGQSGNPGGREKTKWLTQALRMELAQNPKRARTIADKIITMAEEGDLQAASLIFDRLEGKAVQQVQVEATVTALTSEQRLQRLAELQNRISSVIDVTPVEVDVAPIPALKDRARDT